MKPGSTISARFLALIFWIAVPCGPLLAQYNTNFLNYSHTGRSVAVNLDFEAGSNGMSSDFVNKLVWGGHISNDLKEKSSGNLRGRNNFGIIVNYDACAFVKGNSRFDFLIGVKNQEVLNASYTRDFFNLMFYGNQAYQGKTANLSQCSVNALRFQEVKFGTMINQVDSVGRIGVSVSFIKGEQLFYIKTQNSNLYTSPDGGELIFNSNFNMAVSDTNNRRIGSFNGIGASADIYFETSYKSKVGKRSVLVVNVNNIGFIHWRNNSVQYSSDSSLRYTGYHITTLNDLRDSTLRRIKGDSLLRNVANARSDDFNVNIPTNLVMINKVYFGDERFALSTGYRFIFNANYKSYIFLEPEYRYRQMTFSLHTGYGGYTRLNVGAAVSWISPGWFIRLGSNSLQGFVVPKYAFGQGVFFTIAKKFR
jgi:hypothetical protein